MTSPTRQELHLRRGSWLAIFLVAALLVLTGGAYAIGRNNPESAATATSAQQATGAPTTGMRIWAQRHDDELAWMRSHHDDVSWMRNHPGAWHMRQAVPDDRTTEGRDHQPGWMMHDDWSQDPRG
jgi:hypothetical protein